MIRHGLGLKKTLLASEQQRSDVRRQREEWTRLHQPRMGLEPHRLVFLDETGTTTKMTRLRGRAPAGARLKMHAPFGHWCTQTFIAGLRCDGLTAPWVLDGPMNRRAFEAYVETQLAPTLAKGDVVIMDNLSSHKSPRVVGVAPEARRLVPLPPALFPRSQSNRNGLRQAQGASAQAQRANHRGAVDGHRRHLRPLHHLKIAGTFSPPPDIPVTTNEPPTL